MPHVWWPHQHAAFAYAKDRDRIALFMEMRLGKSSVAIRWALQRWPSRILIVAPLEPIYDWKAELEEEGVAPSDIIDLTNISKKVREELAYGGGRGFYLINYESVRATDFLADCAWDCLILDESTRIRNPRAQITKRILHDYGHVPRRAILSGLPRPESELDYFCQFEFLHGSFIGFHNYWSFREKAFNVNDEPGREWDRWPKPGIREKIKEYLHEHAFVLTTKQAKMGNTAIYERRVVPMTPKQRAAHQEVWKKYSYEYIETNYATVRDVWMARIAGGFSPDRENPELLSNAKTQAIYDLLTGELKGKQVVIWFRFTEELEHVVRFLKSKRIRCAGIYGATPKPERARLRQAFSSGQVNVLCVQIQVGKYGLNLSASSTAIYYSNSYALEDREQSEKRIEHGSKSEPLLYIDLMTDGSIDAAVVSGLREKKRNAKQFMQRLQRFIAAEWEVHHGTLRKKEEAQGAVHQKKISIRRRYPTLPMQMRLPHEDEISE